MSVLEDKLRVISIAHGVDAVRYREFTNEIEKLDKQELENKSGTEAFEDFFSVARKYGADPARKDEFGRKLAALKDEIPANLRWSGVLVFVVIVLVAYVIFKGSGGGGKVKSIWQDLYQHVP